MNFRIQLIYKLKDMFIIDDVSIVPCLAIGSLKFEFVMVDLRKRLFLVLDGHNALIRYI